MKQYKFIRVRRKVFGFSYRARINGRSRYPREVIKDLAARGYGLKCIVPVSSYAQALYEYDMVFERDTALNVVYEIED